MDATPHEHAPRQSKRLGRHASGAMRRKEEVAKINWHAWAEDEEAEVCLTILILSILYYVEPISA